MGHKRRNKNYESDLDFSKQRNLTYIKKDKKQSNHGDYTIPSGMEEWAEEPLYIIIAQWCFQQQRWVNRKEIGAVFKISERRVSFQLFYIYRKTDRVSCYKRKKISEHIHNFHSEIFVTNVIDSHELSSRRGSLLLYNKPRKCTGGSPRSVRVGNAMTGNVLMWDELINKARKV